MINKYKKQFSEECPADIWLENNNGANLSTPLLFINLLERKLQMTK